MSKELADIEEIGRQFKLMREIQEALSKWISCDPDTMMEITGEKMKILRLPAGTCREAFRMVLDYEITPKFEGLKRQIKQMHFAGMPPGEARLEPKKKPSGVMTTHG